MKTIPQKLLNCKVFKTSIFFNKNTSFHNKIHLKPLNAVFVTSNGWLITFVRRNNLFCKEGQPSTKNPTHLVM